jgi:pimeloyl-ACP methyl ester carboxylesterase
MPDAAFLAAVAAAAAPALHLAVLRARHGGAPGPAETTFVRTPDGATIALYRHRAPDPVPGSEPVLMLSGFGLNHAALDFDDRYSWARRSAAAGLDTWLLEVRGSGRSRRAGRHDGSFDDFLADLRAGLAHVLAATGAERLHGVGYSLGGMLLYAALGTDLADRLRSVVAIESPTSLEGIPVGRATHALLDVIARHGIPHALPYRLPSRLAMPVLPLYHDRPMFRTWANLENMDRGLIPRILYRTLDDVPAPLALQLRDWTTCDTLRSVGGGVDHLRGLAGSRVPVLVVTGASDFGRRARPALVRLAGTGAEGVECLRSAGFSADYGHADLIFGKAAPDEVLPHVLRWLRRHDPGMAAIT